MWMQLRLILEELEVWLNKVIEVCFRHFMNLDVKLCIYVFQRESAFNPSLQIY